MGDDDLHHIQIYHQVSDIFVKALGANKLFVKLVEMLTWTGKETHSWISDVFNNALQHDMPYDQTTNWIKPLHKGGDGNNVNKNRTIMIGSLMAKLFGCIMESKIIAWAKQM